jgi:iron(II)-dependent oxidoreductase
MDVKERIVAELTAARDRSFGLTVEALEAPELTAQVSPLMSPLVWDLAHIGNYEEQWLLRAAAGAAAVRPDIDDIYDAFEHPRAERPSLPLLSPAESRAYVTTVRDRVLDSLEKVPLVGALAGDGFVYHMVIQHEHQHDETMLATHQLRRGAPALLDPPDTGPVAGEAVPAEVLVPGGPFLMGTSDDPWAYDNERPGHLVDVPSFHIDTTPVGNAAYAAFIEAGGYRDPRWWHPKGWEWRSRTGKEAPAFWYREGGQWMRRRFGLVEPVPMDEPVQHVCWYEADAYAGGRAGGCRPRRSGRRPRAGTRWRAANGGCPGATPARPTRTPTSGSAGTGPRRWARTRTARRPTACASSSGTSGSGPRPTSTAIRASGPSRTGSTPRCSSAMSTRC